MHQHALVGPGIGRAVPGLVVVGDGRRHAEGVGVGLMGDTVVAVVGVGGGPVRIDAGGHPPERIVGAL